MLPFQSWNAETKRFYNDIVFNTVALSGMGFFFLTRKFIVNATATIVSYEIILLQFRHYNSSQSKSGDY